MLRPGEIIVVSFAGGGGSSLGVEWATGRPVDVARNHDPEAIAMHRVNHPATQHRVEDVWHADPRDDAAGRPVGLAWFSPDCRHFSKAKGSKPVEKKIRDLAWVVVRWAKRVRPRIICLENVEEFRDWGPLTEDGKPCPIQKGLIFRRWVQALRDLGYRVDWRELRACDYGAPTIRKRLFLVARCDGEPIVWPAPTHGPKGGGGLRPYRTAAECIDWSLPCPSIFLAPEDAAKLGVRRPLAEATLRRIARGVKRYVIDAVAPFIVPLTHRGDSRVYALSDPLRTVTTAKRGEQALVAPFLARTDMHKSNAACTYSADQPLRTVTTGGGHGVVAAFMAQHNTGMIGHDARSPVSTLTQRGTQQQVVAVNLSHQYGWEEGGGNGDPRRPLRTVTANGGHHALVAAFLAKYYSAGVQGQDAREPLHTVATKARFGAVTVTIEGQSYAIVDIGMRMLSPRELFRAQGFPDSYVIDLEVDGRPLSKGAQIRMCGNSVCPQMAEAVVRANLGLGERMQDLLSMMGAAD
ncbi:MAG: DNA cytosine methyltransferase [Kiloniellales bacterium]|nr:DNA cytosine methyltransferase [Kiloniellales bacterium]